MLITINRSAKNKDPAGIKYGWEKVETSIQELEELVKKGQALCAGVSASKTKPNNRSISFNPIMAIDIDNDDPNDQFTLEDALNHPLVRGKASFIYTTFSHTPEQHRFRIVYRLQSILLPKQYEKLVKFFIQGLPNADPSCKDPSRIFYGNTNTEIYHVGHVLPSYFIAHKLGEKTYTNDTAPEVEDARELLSCIPKEPGYDTWLKVLSAIGNTFPEDVATELIEEWSPDKQFGTRYKIQHRLPNARYGLAVTIAQDYGYVVEQDLPAKDTLNTEDIIIVANHADFQILRNVGFLSVTYVPEYRSNKLDVKSIGENIELLNSKDRVTIVLPNTKKGNTYYNEITRRLRKNNLFFSFYPNNKEGLRGIYKDFGEEGVIEYVAGAEPVPVEGVILSSQVTPELVALYENGKPKGFKIKRYDFDHMIQMFMKALYVSTGVPGHGKSNFMDYYMVLQMLTNGIKWAVYSPESGTPEMHKYRLVEILIGKSFFEPNSQGMERVTPEEFKMADEFLNEHLTYIYSEGTNYTVEDILRNAEWAVAKKGIRGLLIDPWNTLEHHIKPAESEHLYTGRALNRIKFFARDCDIAAWVVAHPRKLEFEKKKIDGVMKRRYSMPGPYDISGSSNWFNIPDGIMTIYRHLDDRAEVAIQKVKHKFMGKKGSAMWNFDTASQRFYPAGEPRQETAGNWLA